MQHNRDGEQKLFSLFGLFSLFFLSANVLFAESFADFKRVQKTSYAKYKDERDSAFDAYLKAQWQEYKAYITPSMYKKPKPKSIEPKEEKKPLNVGPIVKIEIPEKKKSKKFFYPQNSLKRDIGFDFFGSKVAFSFDKKIKKATFYPQDQSGIANFFTILASSNYKNTIDEIEFYKKSLQLNDWALYLLVSKLSKKVFHNKNEAKIYGWFLLNKLSYSVKIALGESKNLYLLYYSKDIIYETPRYSLNEKNYYIVSQYNKQNIERIYTYEKDYPKANKALDFTLKRLPLFKEERLNKTVSFLYGNKVYKSSYSYNRNIVDFMHTYPQVDYKIYFNATMEQESYREIVKDIKSYIDGMKMSEAINFVLRFVQKAFKYERDSEQFGHEKVMFAEETLVYNASDCEDRAVLFAYLVKRIFGITVIGVKYSDHMSTALLIPLKGDSVLFENKRYVLADPTYINANIGQEMPKYKNIHPEYCIVLK